MPPPGPLRISLAVAVASVVLGAGLIHFQRPARRGGIGDVEITGLRSALEKTAEASLPAPLVTTAVLQRVVASEQIAAEVARISAVASDLGGTSLQTEEGNARKLLIQVPAGRVAALCEQISLQPFPASKKPPAIQPENASEFIEVVVTPEQR